MALLPASSFIVMLHHNRISVSPIARSKNQEDVLLKAFRDVRVALQVVCEKSFVADIETCFLTQVKVKKA